MRNPSIRGRVKSRTSVKRYLRHSVGIKMPRGYGVLTNPKKAIYNRIYNRTSFSVDRLFKPSRNEGEGSLSLLVVILIAPIIGFILMFVTTFWVEILITIGIILGLIITYSLIKSNNNLSLLDKSLLKAQKLINKGKYDEIIELLAPLSTDYDIDVYNFLAISYASKGDYKSAIKFWKQIYSNINKEDDIKYFFGNKLSAIFLLNNQLDKAWDIYKELSYRKRIFNNDLMNIGLNMAKSLLNNNKIKEAHTILERIISVKSEDNELSGASTQTNKNIRVEAKKIMIETAPNNL